MEIQVLSSLFFKLIFSITCMSILALDIREKQTFYSSIDHRRQSPKHENQHERFRLPRRPSNEFVELKYTDYTKKSMKILFNSSSLPEKNFNVTHILASEITEKNDESIFDDGLLLLSTNNRKEKKSLTRFIDDTSSDDDDRKTLSQQMKEGKYGLIQNEIYPIKPNRPGIISYLSNSEIPHDTIKNLGGLGEEEIWLAENHMLVLKGGNFPELNTTANQSNTKWEPIDNYKAPSRQVKIPVKPKVPPPFPIQLVEGGPIQFIDTNGRSLVNNATIDIKALSRIKGFFPGEGPYFPFLSINNNSDINPNLLKSTKKMTMINGIMIPFYPALPPGAVIIPPPSNQTDYDDDDQTIYYPSPYSFVYSQDNSTSIPPGPLVPGIILPPPPNFFSSLDEKMPITKDKNAKRINTTSISTITVSYLPSRKSTIKTKTVSYHPKPFIRTKVKNSTFQSKKHITRNYQALPLIDLITTTPYKSIILNDSEKNQKQQIVKNQITDRSTIKPPWKAMVNNKIGPLMTFFVTTTTTSVDESVGMTPTPIKSTLTTENPTYYLNHASYYFYEENNEAPTSTSIPFALFSTTANTPLYYKHKLMRHQKQEEKQHMQYQPQQQKKEYYKNKMIPSQYTKDYNVKLIDSIIKNPHVYSYLDSVIKNNQQKFEIPPIEEHNSMMFYTEPQYYQHLPTRSAPELNYVTTEKPQTYYRKPIIENLGLKPCSSKSKPIYQYSFEATNYVKQTQTLIQNSQIPKKQNLQSHHQHIYNSQRQKTLPLYSDYKNIQRINDQYNKANKMINDDQVRAQKILYLNGKKSERQPSHHHSTTASPMYITTPTSHQQYFTQQDEQLLDDVTKEYFTVFGKKLSSSELSSTTPLYDKSIITDRAQPSNVNAYKSKQFNRIEPNSFTASNIKVRYGNQTPGPFALKDDILVNYKLSIPLPTLNSNNDIISLVNMNPKSAAITQNFKPQFGNQIRDYSLSSVPNTHPDFDQIQTYVNSRLEHQQQNLQEDTSSSFIPMNGPREMIREPEYSRPLSLENDILVNYKHFQPEINPDAEFINKRIPSHVYTSTDKAKSYFAYKLPGNTGHFYFLTPKAINREDSRKDYIYPRSRSSRLL